jgi:nucleoside H+ symporter
MNTSIRSTDVRASAQGLFNLMILGFGPLVANVLGPRLIGETFNSAGVVDFRSLFLVPCAAAVFAAVVLRSSFTRRNRRGHTPPLTHDRSCI